MSPTEACTLDYCAQTCTVDSEEGPGRERCNELGTCGWVACDCAHHTEHCPGCNADLRGATRHACYPDGSRLTLWARSMHADRLQRVVIIPAKGTTFAWNKEPRNARLTFEAYADHFAEAQR